MELVYVPAGDFLMGSTDDDPDAAHGEVPQHPVYLDGYWIDKTEVTNAMFARFVDATGYDARIWRNAASGKSDHPVVLVNWHDASAYCEWAGRKLPTEAQWEKAARGTDGRRYPWGNGAPAASRSNFDDNVGGTTPVGSYPAGASPYGAMDMAGNVLEWVADWYNGEYYTVSPRENPTGPATGQDRLLRGGSCYNDAWGLRSSCRYIDVPVNLGSYVGFRCARP